MPRRRFGLSLIATWTLLSLAAGEHVQAARRDPAVVYDSDYSGYLPIVDGIQRPDLVTRRDDGRVPETLSKSVKRARRTLAGRSQQRGWAYQSFHEQRIAPRPPARRWQKRQGLTIDLSIEDRHGLPIAGARVFLASDPAFYAVNDDNFGARLFGSYRYLPYSYPDTLLLEDVLAHEAYWSELRQAPVQQLTADIDQRRNPWLRDGAPVSTPPVEFVGTSNDAGRLQLVSGIFNLLDPKRFPLASAPQAFRLLVCIVADGFSPTVQSWRFEHGGSRESRGIVLLEATDKVVFAGDAWKSVQHQLDQIAVDPTRHVDEIANDVSVSLRGLDTDILRLDETQRPLARRRAEATAWERLSRRTPLELQLRVLQRAIDAEPTAARYYRLGSVLATSADQQSAEQAFGQALQLSPRFRPAAIALDARLASRRAPKAERQLLAERAFRLAPFDRWARARLAALALSSDKANEAFDHLRYTWSSAPGLGSDRELAERLFDYYWRLGLVEKAGSYLWMLSGSPPEDPSLRVTR